MQQYNIFGSNYAFATPPLLNYSPIPLDLQGFKTLPLTFIKAFLMKSNWSGNHNGYRVIVFWAYVPYDLAE